MSFEVTANAYSRFMGRYSEPLADQFVELLDLRDGQRALDVGCGPGALTERLVRRLGADAVTAVDPSESFVAAVRSRIPSIDVHRAAAEDMPFADRHFDCAAAQLVVHFMKDPVAGIIEMARVTNAGGAVAACVWDHAGETGPLSAFWRAVKTLDPGAPDEAGLAGAREGHLVELFERAGLSQIDAMRLTVRVPFAGFDEWWEPFTLGVGPAGRYVAGLDAGGRAALAAECTALLPAAPFEITASAWAAVGRV
ncbi:class I SAM-dependent methyltransferase [Nakamurella sp. GG22]